jgi:GTP cyclohydrolase FolE2
VSHSLLAPIGSNLPATADPQNTSDPRGVSIDSVGIDRVMAPLLIAGWSCEEAPRELPCRISCSVSLASGNRGIHMSRMVETISAWREAVTPDTLPRLLQVLADSQGSTSAEIRVAFTWFQKRQSPVSRISAPQAIETLYWAELPSSRHGFRVNVPVTTLCPCSRDISDYGAHSQRGWIGATLGWHGTAAAVPPETIVTNLGECGSAPIYPVLKRSDERAVTMQAYDNPVFVEDLARNALIALRDLECVEDFSLEIRNEESIHTHDAVARIVGRGMQTANIFSGLHE